MQQSGLCVASKGQISSYKRHLQLADRFLFSPRQIFCHSKSPRANSCQSIKNSVTHCRGKPGHPRRRWCHIQVLFILQINVLAVWMELSALLGYIIQIPGLILDPVAAYSKQYLIYTSVPPDELQCSNIKQPRPDPFTFPVK